MPLGLLLVSVLSLASAQDFGSGAKDIVSGAQAMKQARSRRKTQAPAIDCGEAEGKRGEPAYKKECVCQGKRFLRAMIYKQNSLSILPSADGLPDFQIARMIQDAEAALNYHGLTLGYTNMPQGQDQVRSFGPAAFVTLRNYSEILKNQKHDPKAEPEALGAIDELCKVVADGFKQRPPGNAIPIFLLNYSENLKKMTRGDGTEAVGHTFTAASFREMCARLGEDLGELPSAFIAIQSNPDGGVRQVFIHEIGHAIGKYTSTPWFGDRYPSDRLAKDDPGYLVNVMASQANLAPGQMKMTSKQVETMCAAPFVTSTEY